MIARVKNKYRGSVEQAYNWWTMGEKVTFRVPKIRGENYSSLSE